MRIVKLTPERWPEYKELRLTALRTDPDAFGATYASSLARPDEWWQGVLEAAEIDPNRTVLFAEVGGELVGLAGAYPEQEAGCVDVTQMFVRPEHRGKGIGRALLKAVVEEVKAEKIRLCVNSDFPAAVALYKDFGFEVIAESEGVRSDGSRFPEYFMELRRQSGDNCRS